MTDPLETKPIVDPQEMSTLDEIIYRISHDLKTSVRALQELPVWLEEDLKEEGITLSGETSVTLSMIHSHARRLDEMITGLLSYSRVGRLQQEVEIEPSTVFNAALQDLGKLENVKVVKNFQTFAVQMGERDLRQMFDILLSNAIKHHGPGDVKIEVTSCRYKKFWEFLVSDNGPGIADVDAERIFKPMVKLVSRDVDEGGGMGLATLQKIVSRYAGSIDIEARKRAGGTTFRVRLPVAVL